LVRDPGLATSWRVHSRANSGLAALSRWMKRDPSFSTVELWLATLTLLGVVGALLLARTVRAATRAAAS
jgi:hypothetical protein